jgi:MFS family permease
LSIRAANASGFLMSGAIFSAAFLTSQYFQLGLGYGPLATGLRLLPWTATPMLVAPLSGAVADRIGTRPLMAAGLALQAVGLGWVAWLASADGGYGRFVLPMIIAWAGISMAIPTVSAAALGAVAPADMGRASGVNNTLQRFGGAFGVAVAAAVFSAHGQLGSPAGVTAGFRPALAVSALLSLLGAAAAVLAGRRGGLRAAGHAARPEALAGRPGARHLVPADGRAAAAQPAALRRLR